MNDNDVRDDLRELLQRRADDVPPHGTVPRSLVGRARRRIALNAVGVGLAVVVLAGGAWAGLRTFGTTRITPGATGGTGIAPTTQPTVIGSANPPTQPTPTYTAIASCTAGQLRANGAMEGAAGSREGAIVISNYSDQTCTLQGTPTIELLDQSLNPITSGITFMTSPPQWAVQTASPTPPPGWPVVTLQPGDSAQVRIRWGNWCPAGVPLWRVDIPGGGYVNVTNGMEDVPPCNGPGMPSTIEVGPFEPAPPPAS